jgi:NadR type nicotinamide-nucleotide adenylyltransferase
MSARLVVVVTGSECTGKTTLARGLARSFGTAWSAEHARAFVEHERRAPQNGDVEAIARGQIAGEDAAAEAARRLVVRDTDLVSTAIYARHYFGACPAWIERAAAERKGDLYLLCHPDVPWVADGLQRDRSASRDEVHALFEDALRDLGTRVVAIRGPWPEREAAARAAVEALLEGARSSGGG